MLPEIEIVPDIGAAENVSEQSTEIVTTDHIQVQEPEIEDAIHVPVNKTEVAQEKVVSRFKVGNVRVSEIEIDHTLEDLFEPKEPVKAPDRPRKVVRDVDLLRAFFKGMKKE